MEIDKERILWRTRGKSWDYSFLSIPDGIGWLEPFEFCKKVFTNQHNGALSDGVLFSSGYVRQNDKSTPYIATKYIGNDVDEFGRPIIHYLAFFPVAFIHDEQSILKIPKDLAPKFLKQFEHCWKDIILGREEEAVAAVLSCWKPFNFEVNSDNDFDQYEIFASENIIELSSQDLFGPRLSCNHPEAVSQAIAWGVYNALLRNARKPKDDISFTNLVKKIADKIPVLNDGGSELLAMKWHNQLEQWGVSIFKGINPERFEAVLIEFNSQNSRGGDLFVEGLKKEKYNILEEGIDEHFYGAPKNIDTEIAYKNLRRILFDLYDKERPDSSTLTKWIIEKISNNKWNIQAGENDAIIKYIKRQFDKKLSKTE